ncbi:MAG: efflux RND transporter periplasmic adaptor subunit [Saprospiraceae bacterium]|nr:efflux RND transporter periplasmic adaptor subunit [Saprospiraceae bacterium]
MKRLRINILYWLVLPALAYGIYKLSLNFDHQAETFFGFAENKEMQINLEHPLMVNRIAVTPGQAVKKGDLLLEVTRVELDLKLSDVAHNISELEARTHISRAELQSNINRLKAQRTEKMSDIQSQIHAIEAEIALNEMLVKDLKSVKVSDTNPLSNPSQLKINALKEELRLVVQPLDIEIAHLENELKGQNPMQVEINRLKTQRDFIVKEQKRLSIYAPSDGLVGSIHCKEGENISSFTTLISFYEKSPNMVVGYVHESFIVQVNIGDSISVVSSLHPTEKCRGKVLGLGHRIVEIPERLRKIPEMKTYGREILIQIPSDNQFLQSETVVLNLLNKEKGFFQTLSSLISKPDAKQVN